MIFFSPWTPRTPPEVNHQGPLLQPGSRWRLLPYWSFQYGHAANPRCKNCQNAPQAWERWRKTAFLIDLESGVELGIILEVWLIGISNRVISYNIHQSTKELNPHVITAMTNRSIMLLENSWLLCIYICIHLDISIVHNILLFPPFYMYNYAHLIQSCWCRVSRAGQKKPGHSMASYSLWCATSIHPN